MIGMISRQRATPLKRERFSGFSWTEVEAGHVLSTPIVNCVAELDGATWTVGCNMNGCRIGDNDGTTAGYAFNGFRPDRHPDIRDVKWGGRSKQACVGK